MNLDTKTWLITGCSSGLGLALAECALAKGHRVVATARNLEAIAHLEAQHPDACRTLPLDVTNAAQVQAAAQQALAAWGRVDVLVNNAGRGLVGAFEELSPAQIQANFATNFFGAMELVRAVLPTMRAQRSGHIVNISAAAAISNYPGFSIYGAAKWALEGASESLAAELKPLGIKVTIVEPGPFRTGFIKRSMLRAEKRIADYEATSGKFEKLIDSMDGRQPGDPARAAEAILAAVAAQAPPLRLALGKYANGKLAKKLADTEKERAAWEPVALQADFQARP